MRVASLLLAISIPLSTQAEPANPCRNGSFEVLTADGIPIDWAPLGHVALSGDAHSGKHSLRLVRTV